MIEGLDPKSKAKWDRKLREVGLPARIKKTEIPIPPPSAKEVLMTFIPNIEVPLEKFVTLPGKIQDDILADLKKQRDFKMPPREVLDRFEILITKGQELNKMTATDSDNKPRLPREKLEEMEIDESITRSVNELIRRIEEIRSRDNFQPKGTDKYKN